MDAGALALIAILGACMLMMFAMHRLGGRSGRHRNEKSPSLEELRQRRGELDAEISRPEEAMETREGESAADVRGPAADEPSRACPSRWR
jgi:hypothetical protein